jgi:outer membrane protein assembly factor BamB
MLVRGRRGAGIKAMNAAVAVCVACLALAVAPAGPVLTSADIAGAWAGEATHDGESTEMALVFEPLPNGTVVIRVTIPAIALADVALGGVPFKAEGNVLTLGVFTFTYDRAEGTLRGLIPSAFVPADRIPLTLRRVERVALPRRPEPGAPVAAPAWTFDAGAPLWGSAAFADGRVFVGGDDGRLHALDARTGKALWSFQARGAIRTRPTVTGDDLYLHADDGLVYKLGAADGRERWRARAEEGAVTRIPAAQPKPRFERFGSDVTVAEGRVYVGTHDGRVVALDAGRGEKRWEFRSGDSVLAAPAVEGGRVYFGSFDGHVYALDAGKGTLVWKHDARGPVVSTPALAEDTLVVGSRSYDLLGLDAATGARRWKRYFWFSWIESSATVRDGVAYVGSSDTSRLQAFDAHTGERRWAAEAYGWPWGQPAVSADRVYVGAVGDPATGGAQRGGAIAVDRKSGRTVWRLALTPPASGQYGVGGSPALGAGLVFFPALDGRLYALSP